MFETFEFESEFIKKNNTIELNQKHARHLFHIEIEILDFISRMNFTNRMSSLVFHFDCIQHIADNLQMIATELQVLSCEIKKREFYDEIDCEIELNIFKIKSNFSSVKKMIYNLKLNCKYQIT